MLTHLYNTPKKILVLILLTFVINLLFITNICIFAEESNNSYLILGKIYLDRYEKELSPNIKQDLLREAYKNYYSASLKDPGCAEAHIGLARIYKLQGHNDKSYDELLRANELGTENPETLYYLGELFYSNGSYEKSVRYLNKSLENGNKDFEPHYYLGLNYEKLGDLEAAKNEYITALKNRPENNEVRSKLEDLIRALNQE